MRFSPLLSLVQISPFEMDKDYVAELDDNTSRSYYTGVTGATCRAGKAHRQPHGGTESLRHKSRAEMMASKAVTRVMHLAPRTWKTGSMAGALVRDGGE